MPFCMNCGEYLPEGAKFCINCGTNAVTGESNTYKKRTEEYAGKIIKCPSCGETVKALESTCPACGHEFRGTSTSSVVKEFALKLEQIEKSREVKKTKLFSTDHLQLSKTDKQIISLISSFPIPNTKEDLFEFLVLAASNINEKRYSNELTLADASVSDAWYSKFEQAYQKSKALFGDDSNFQQFNEIYHIKNEKVNKAKKKYKRTEAVIFIGLFLFLIIAYGGIFLSDNIKISKETERLESIVEEVYDYIEKEEYIMARSKASTLVFSGSTTEAGNQAVEKWDITRKQLFEIIDLAEADSFDSDTSNVGVENNATTITSNKNDYLEEFIGEYEKAEFQKFNSPASENGLAGTPLYIEGNLIKTEILEANGTKTILGYMQDLENNNWIIKLHVVPLVSENEFDSYIGKQIIMKVIYDGYSGKLEMPSCTLDEIIDIETGNVMYGMQKLLDE